VGVFLSAAILVVLFLVLTFYFTLSFFEYLHANEQRIVKQSKYAAISCFGIAMTILAIVGYIGLF